MDLDVDVITWALVIVLLPIVLALGSHTRRVEGDARRLRRVARAERTTLLKLIRRNDVRRTENRSRKRA